MLLLLILGDTRLERDYVNKYLTDLEHKKIKHLYLDTTFCTDQHREFITKVKQKKNSVLSIMKVIQRNNNNSNFKLESKCQIIM